MANFCRCLQKKFGAKLLANFANLAHRVYSDVKLPLFEGLPNSVVEVGAGCGANFRYYLPQTKITAIEPNVFMHPYLKSEAAKYDLNLEIKSDLGQSITLPNESSEAVVMTLVLCSVESPISVLSEIFRLLRPGGTYIFVEHVLAPTTMARVIQKTWYYPWQMMFDGCRLTRDSMATINGQPFADVKATKFNVGSSLFPFSTHIAGVARKLS